MVLVRKKPTMKRTGTEKLYYLTDGHEISEVALMTPLAFEVMEEDAKRETDGTFKWVLVADLPVSEFCCKLVTH